MKRRALIIVATLLLYASVIGATTWGLFAARRSVTDTYSNTSEQEAWDEFRTQMDERHVQREAIREEIARESGQPIVPRSPKSRSPRPPALELLTNHFAACVAVSLLAVSGLFAVIWGMILGAVLRPGRSFAERGEHDAKAEVRRAGARQLR
jgi:hypothetical protein